MDARSLALTALALVLTYAIHSTLLLGLASLLSARVRSLALRERMWKVALLGGLATASIQVAGRFETPLAHWRLQLAELAASAESTERAHASNAALDPSAAPAALAEPVDRAEHALAGQRSSPLPAPAVTESVPATRAPTVAAEPRPPPVAAGSTVWSHWRDWTARGLALWAAFAASVLAAFVGMWLRLTRSLRGRVELADGPLRDALDRLVPLAFPRAARVRLYVAPEVAAPLSFGFFRRAICIPPRAVTELSLDEQESMLAHELAHLARRDPLWLSVAWIVARVFFFQPLNRIARAELAEIAELRCDDWAAARTGQRLALASCLARIAEWIVGAPRSLPATAMADGRGRSRLKQRIERLLDEDLASDERPVRWLAPVAAAALASLVLVVPGVCATRGVTAPLDAGAASALAAELEIDVARTVAQSESVPRPVLRLEFDALDESIELLRGELAGLRGELSDDEPRPELVRTLDAFQARLERLEARRGALRALLQRIEALELEGAAASNQRIVVKGP